MTLKVKIFCQRFKISTSMDYATLAFNGFDFQLVLFDHGTKKIARYQQYFVTKKSIQRVHHLEKDRREGGVIWHTQGSGKSLTMVMLAQAIAMDKSIRNPKIILVTDRTDLDRQITGTFRKCGRFVENASTVNA